MDTEPQAIPLSHPDEPVRVRDAAPAARPRWDEAPMAHKVPLLVLVSMVAGVAIGMVEARLGHGVLPLAVGVTVVGALLIMLANRWVTTPFIRFTSQMQRITTHRRPGDLQQLPTERRDEIGQMARTAQQLGLAAVRGKHDAGQLRRTMDQRVGDAARKATHRLERIVMRDPLTDCGNRRFLDESLPCLIDSANAAHEELICLAIDLDHFKAVNDTLGHAAGDELLIFVGSLIRANTRSQDVAVRQGGDEFLALLPGASIDRGRQLAHQLLAMFAQHAKAAYPGELRPSLSIGMAGLRRDSCADGDALLAKADAYLYEAKKAGRGVARGV